MNTGPIVSDAIVGDAHNPRPYRRQLPSFMAPLLAMPIIHRLIFCSLIVSDVRCRWPYHPQPHCVQPNSWQCPSSSAPWPATRIIANLHHSQPHRRQRQRPWFNFWQSLSSAALLSGEPLPAMPISGTPSYTMMVCRKSSPVHVDLLMANLVSVRLTQEKYLSIF